MPQGVFFQDTRMNRMAANVYRKYPRMRGLCRGGKKISRSHFWQFKKY